MIEKVRMYCTVIPLSVVQLSLQISKTCCFSARANSSKKCIVSPHSRFMTTITITFITCISLHAVVACASTVVQKETHVVRAERVCVCVCVCVDGCGVDLFWLGLAWASS